MLDYQLQTGWLEPFIHGLLQGKAVARCCSACNKTSYPPIRVCECNHVNAEWVNLSGEAKIVFRCDGTEGSFALVQFDGADTQSVVRLDDIEESDTIAYLQRFPADSQNDTPALVLTAQQRANDSR